MGPPGGTKNGTSKLRKKSNYFDKLLSVLSLLVACPASLFQFGFGSLPTLSLTRTPSIPLSFPSGETPSARSVGADSPQTPASDLQMAGPRLPAQLQTNKKQAKETA